MSTSVIGDEVETVGAAGNPAVLLLHPWWGVNAAVREWAEILAAAGRRVVLPDLYGGKVVTTVQEAEAMADALDEEAAFGLLQRCADELAAEGQPWVAMGFSLGAFLACMLAGLGTSEPDELILFYGGQPPSGAVSRTRRVSLHVVPDDEYFTDEERAQVEDDFRSSGAELQVYRYPGSSHWFAERGSPAFDEVAFELARTRVLEQLRG